MPYDSLPAAIRAAYEHSGLSLAELAARVPGPDGRPVTRGLLGQYATGDSTPPATRLIQIATATGCDLTATAGGRWLCQPKRKSENLSSNA